MPIILYRILYKCTCLASHKPKFHHFFWDIFAHLCCAKISTTRKLMHIRLLKIQWFHLFIEWWRERFLWRFKRRGSRKSEANTGATDYPASQSRGPRGQLKSCLSVQNWSWFWFQRNQSYQTIMMINLFTLPFVFIAFPFGYVLS